MNDAAPKSCNPGHIAVAQPRAVHDMGRSWSLLIWTRFDREKALLFLDFQLTKGAKR